MVVPPTPHGAVGSQGYAVDIASAEGHGRVQAGYRRRRAPVSADGAVAQLSPVILAPSPNVTVASLSQGVVHAADHRYNPRQTTDRDGRAALWGINGIGGQLSPGVESPSP